MTGRLTLSRRKLIAGTAGIAGTAVLARAAGAQSPAPNA